MFSSSGNRMFNRQVKATEIRLLFLKNTVHYSYRIFIPSCRKFDNGFVNKTLEDHLTLKHKVIYRNIDYCGPHI